MEFRGIFTHKRTLPVLVTLVIAAAFVWLSSTQAGRLVFSQLGVNDSIAKTLDAAENAAKQTGAALNSFIGRSPGERGATDAIKGKAKRLAKANNRPLGKIADLPPSQRALGKIFDKPVNGAPEQVSSQPTLAVLPSEVPFAGPVQGVTPIGSGTPGIFVPSTGGNFIGGGGGGGGTPPGGGGGNGGTPGTPPPPPPVISAVPEPSTWILLLFGFGAIGASVRRTKAMVKREGNCVHAR